MHAVSDLLMQLIKTKIGVLLFPFPALFFVAGVLVLSRTSTFIQHKGLFRFRSSMQ